MKLLTVIGTRPQYIKVKPLYYYFIENKINNVLVDTCQHYSSNVSKVFIDEFGLGIDYKLQTYNANAVTFIRTCMEHINVVIDKEKPDCIIVMGDTNSTLSAALVARKKNIKLAHIEAGVRCGDRNRPEEMNRILVDELSDIHFLSRKKDSKNVSNPVYVGDLEYTFLNQLENKGKLASVRYGEFLIMTIHREENSNPERLKEIFEFCGDIDKPINFPIHHRIKKIIDKYNIKIPLNIKVIDPLPYGDIIRLISYSDGVITDSGGITKICPYFGKKCIVPSNLIEWDEVEEKGYAKRGLDEGFLKNKYMKRDRKFYFNDNCCETIVNTLEKIL